MNHVLPIVGVPVVDLVEVNSWVLFKQSESAGVRIVYYQRNILLINSDESQH